MTAQRKKQNGDFMDIVAREQKKPVKPMFDDWEKQPGIGRRTAIRRR
jgi:hypothetical protein